MNFNKRLRLANEKAEAGEHALNTANYQQAVDNFLEASELFKGIKGQEQSYTSCLVNAANALDNLGNYTKAETLLNKAIPIQKKILGSEHPDMATSLGILAIIYQAQGDYAKSIEFNEKALTIFEKHFGSQHPDTAGSLNNLATIYQAQGDYAKAIEFNEKALAIFEKHFGSQHPDVASSFNNLATIYSDQGDYAKATEFHEKALAIREKLFGSQHPDVASSLNNLATIYQAQGDYAKANEFYDKALAIWRNKFGNEHVAIATGLNNLAESYRKQGKHAEAKQLHQQALAIREGKLGFEHPKTTQSLINLAETISTETDNTGIFSVINQLHKTILQFLLQKRENNPQLFFTLRTHHNDEQGRLSKGYWFLGEEEFLYFSFWKGIDSTNQMPTIAIEIDLEQQLTITFNGNDSHEKTDFLQDITQLLDGFIQSTDGKQWKKTYSQDWQSALDAFLIDKTQIDDYLAFKGNQIADFSFIPETEFLQALKFTTLLRQKLESAEIKTLTEIGKPLKLHSLQLENIGHFESLGIDLSRQVTIFIGENGSGKSTILKAIALALSGIAGTLDTELVQDYLRILKTEFDGTKQFCNSGSIYLNLQINAVQSQIIEFNQTELRGVTVKTFVDNEDEWLLSSENRFIDLVLGFPQGKKRAQKSVGKIVEPNLNDVIDLIEDRDIANWKNDLVEWIVALYRQPDAKIREDNLLQINWFFDIFSKIISDTDANAIRLKSAVHDPATGKKDIIICTPDMPDGISLDLLSKGYTNIFIWVGRLVMRLYSALAAHQTAYKNDKNSFLRNQNTRGKRYQANTIEELHGIVLIDEIDTYYLHLNWQRNILRVLTETFPCLQFVVTSHSVIGLSSLKNKDNYFIYRAVKETKQVVFVEIDPTKENPYGADLNTIADDFMGVPEREPEIKDKLETLRSAIARKQIEEADNLISELEAEINPEDEELNKLKSRLDAKKLIVSKK
ncbi:tetratricopeptide repeat protein [Beggiatoa leptomitoformis]|uniref:Tetratricopeptide repeat protein n=1 Tax=Beggiatoa leptomitoformis TaxID=288004 RepID=A0A2N9YI93_9GAMM|nr:tetratricopeptide repeat protein [Beggiatoa leptomitoformis]AUI69936.1 tetratricopeptide repeat protein [Beggiatoa leptomitoformis]QGX03660.1 tetratricopeptide repeat protein [Beggiatoa leptomitoformis]